MITVILKFEIKYTDAIVDIFYNASLLAHPFLSEEFVAQEKINIRDVYLAAVETWILMDEDKVIGFISTLQNEVMALFVNPAFHHKGYGRKLMNKAVLEVGDLEVVVFKENAMGRNFYDGYGFKFVEEFMHEPSGQKCLRLKYQEVMTE